MFPGAGLFELAAAAAGMLVACDGLPPATAKGMLLTGAAILAPCLLAADASSQLLVCSVDSR